jgi:hypothetical protein
MKAIKYLLLVTCYAYASSMMAVDYTLYQTSSATFKSTAAFGYYGISNSRTIYNSTPSVSYKEKNSLAPKILFQSTSAMSPSGSSLSLAAATGTQTTYDNSFVSPTGPKRARPEDNDDPYLDPIGDAILPLLLFATGYLLLVARKNHLTRLNK